MAVSWIPSHTSVARHPKTRKLASRLSIPIPAAVGHLHCLWHWAFEIAPDGDLSRFDSEDIAAGALWDSREYEAEGQFMHPDPSEDFLKALIDVGFIDQHGPTLVLHDWDQYAGKATDSARAGQLGNHIRWHKDRGEVDPECEFCRPDIAPESPPTSPDDRPESGGESQNRIEENRSEETKPLTPKTGARKPDPLFDALIVELEIQTDDLTKTQRGSINNALKQLRDVSATPQDIHRRATNYRKTFRDAALTPSALIKHWASLEKTRAPNGHQPYQNYSDADYEEGWR